MFMKIAIDLDGTIFSCNSFLYRFINRINPNLSSRTLRFCEIDKEEERNQSVLSKSIRFFNHEYYQEIEDATSIINKWNKLGHDIIILSSRPSWRVLRASVLNWLDYYAIDFTMLVVACNNKGEFCKKYGVDVLIDDKLSVCKEVEGLGTKTVCLLGEENTSKVKSPVKIVDSWRGVDKAVQQIMDKKILKKIEDMEK